MCCQLVENDLGFRGHASPHEIMVNCPRTFCRTWRSQRDVAPWCRSTYRSMTAGRRSLVSADRSISGGVYNLKRMMGIEALSLRRELQRWHRGGPEEENILFKNVLMWPWRKKKWSQKKRTGEQRRMEEENGGGEWRGSKGVDRCPVGVIMAWQCREDVFITDRRTSALFSCRAAITITCRSSSSNIEQHLCRESSGACSISSPSKRQE